MNMKHIELYEKLEQLLPASLRCEWDNDGVMCMSCPEREVKKVLVTLDITDGAVEKAASEGFDVILSHHPLIFKKVAHLDVRETVPRRLLRLAQHSSGCCQRGRQRLFGTDACAFGCAGIDGGRCAHGTRGNCPEGIFGRRICTVC